MCFGVTEPGRGSGHHEDHHLRAPRRRTLHRQRPEGVDLQGDGIGEDPAADPYHEVRGLSTKKTDGLTLFLTDLDRDKVDIRPIAKMGRNAVTSNELFIDGLEVPVERPRRRGRAGLQVHPRRAEPGAHAWSPPRRWASAARRCVRAVRYGNEREVFGRPIGMNQGIQFPLADSLARLDAAELCCARPHGCTTTANPARREANTAKYLCADAVSTRPTARCRPTAAWAIREEYHVARYFREARLTRIAPISQEMILNYLGSHVLGLPRSY